MAYFKPFQRSQQLFNHQIIFITNEKPRLQVYITFPIQMSSQVTQIQVCVCTKPSISMTIKDMAKTSFQSGYHTRNRQSSESQVLGTGS